MKEEVIQIDVPAGVTAKVENDTVEVAASGKQNRREFAARGFHLEQADGKIVLRADSPKKKVYATMKTVAAHIENMIVGVKKGFEYKLEVVYSHFPINVSVKGDVVEISNLTGSKYPKKAKIVGQTKVEIKGKEIFVRGTDKEAVGQTSANIECAAVVKGKDRRVFQDGIYIVGKDKAKLAEVAQKS